MKVVGVSGPSCCGKSTLARHLRLLLPHAALIYEDDFYKAESELPLDAKGQPNWDVPQSFDLAAMRDRLAAVKESNELPAHTVTREDQNNPSGSFIAKEEEADLRERLSAVLGDEKVLLVDGILLFHEGSPVEDVFDLKLLMPFEVEELKRRREARKGYATGDNSFWVDPPNFFEEVVWPEFKAHCGFLYDGSNYTQLSDVAVKRGIVLAASQSSMKETLLQVAELLARKEIET